MFDQTMSNMMIRLMISQKKLIQKLHKRASMLQWILEMKLAKNRIDDGHLSNIQNTVLH